MAETRRFPSPCHAGSLHGRIRALRAARGGNITIMFALLLVPLLGFTGLAIDYGQVLVARHAAQTAVDSAALYASGAAKASIQNSSGSTTDVANAIADAQQRATALFNANVAKTPKQSVAGQVTVTKTGLTITAVATFTVTTTASLGRLFGQQSYTATGSAKSTASLPPYTNTYMVLDISQSMGLASTTADAQNLFNIVNNLEASSGNPAPSGCVFGCHVPAFGSFVSTSYQQVAINNNIKLRVDVLRSAVINAITTAQKDSAAQNTTNYQIGLYTMSVSPVINTAWSLNQLAPLSSNWSSLQTAANSITLGPNNLGGTGDTYMTEQLNSLYRQIPAGGDGSASNNASTYLFLITDGVRDVPGACASGHCTAAFDPSVCTQFKNANVTVVVIYTTYLPILANPNGGTALNGSYVSLVQPFASSIAPNLQACASPGWYVEASDGPSINAALANMFAKTTIQPSLVN